MPVSPPTTSLFGKQVAIILTTPPASPSAPTLAELNAGIFIQCHTYGMLSQQPEEETGTATRKTCATTQDTRRGPTTWPAIELQYSYRPQEAATPGAEGNEVYEALPEGIEVYAYFADGLDGEGTDALVTGDVVNRGFLVETGAQREGPTGDDSFAEAAVMQNLFPRGGRTLHNYAAPAA